MVPIVIVLICIGWRILKRRKQEEKDEEEFMNIKTRPLDPDESMKINSDDESIPYKKDLPEDSPEPTEPVQIIDNTGYPYNSQYEAQLANQSADQQYPPPPPPQPPTTNPTQARQWQGETEIN